MEYGVEVSMKTKPMQLGFVQIGIVLLAVATAVVHLTLLFPDVMFILNGLGYLGLTGALFLPLPFFKDHRPLVRYGLMGFTLLTIVLWGVMGQRSLLGYSDKVLEIALIVLLWIDRKKNPV
jgi:hypothetical protein